MASEEKPNAPVDISADVEDLRAEVRGLKDELKEREISLFAALKTLARDWGAYSRGERKEAPTSAAWGLLFAYLRRRGYLFALGGLLGAAIAILQLILLSKQNEILRRQEITMAKQPESFTAQTRAAQLSAISQLVMSLGDPDETRRALAAAQLSAYGDYGFDALFNIAVGGDSITAPLAADVIFQTGRGHTARQAYMVFGLMRTLALARSVSIRPEYYSAIGTRVRDDTAFRREFSQQLFSKEGVWRIVVMREIDRIYDEYAGRERAIPAWHDEFVSFCAALTGVAPTASDDERGQQWNAYLRARDTVTRFFARAPIGDCHTMTALPPLTPSVR